MKNNSLTVLVITIIVCLVVNYFQLNSWNSTETYVNNYICCAILDMIVIILVFAIRDMIVERRNK